MRLAIACIVALGMIVVPASFGVEISHEYITSWGYFGASGEARFSGPTGIGMDHEGNVYISDTGNAKIQKYDNVGGLIGEFGNEGETALSSPMGVTVMSDRVYVVDNILESVFMYDLDGNAMGSWGSHGGDPGEFLQPRGIVAHDGLVYVADTGNSKVQVFDSEGKHVRTFGNDRDERAWLRSPIGLAIASDSSVYVADSGINSIHHYNSEGSLLEVIERNVGGYPIRARGITVDAQDILYVADSRNDRILQLGPGGTALSAWGKTGTGIYQFTLPTDVAIDIYGQIFVVNSGGHSIKKYSTPLTLEGVARDAARDAAKAEFLIQTGAAEPAPLVPADAAIEGDSTGEPAAEDAGNPGISVGIQTRAVPGDITKPVIHAPHDVTVEATGVLTHAEIGRATASDASGIQTIQSNAPDSFSLGLSTVIWTAIDGAGNMAVATQQISVTDSVPPEIGTAPDITAEALSPDRNYVKLRAPHASDDVGILDVTSDAPEYFAVGRTVVTWTAHDIMGNTASSVQQVTVMDTSPPLIMAPDDITIEATSVDANDVFLGDARVIDNGEIISVTNDAPLVFVLGEMTVTWIAADSQGNTAHDTQTVHITDTTAPEIRPSDDVIIEATSPASNRIELDAPFAHDIQSFTLTHDAPETFAIGQTPVTWNATDASGNTALAVMNVHVEDTTPPVVSLETVITAEATGYSGNVVHLGDIEITDISDISGISNDAPETYDIGETRVVWTVTDAYGNTKAAIQTVRITDTTPPSLFAPVDVTAEYVGTEGTVVDIGSPTTVDLVRVDSVTNDAPDTFGLGEHTVTWTATDMSGNESVALQRVSILDTLPPVLTVPEDVSVEATGATGMSVHIGEAVAADESEVAHIDNNAPELYEIGTTVVAWSAIDSSENVAVATQLVHVHDTTSPAISAPSDVDSEADSVSNNVIELGDAETEDGARITNDAPTVFAVGETVVTWTATDASGNSASAVQIISIRDTTPPAVTAPDDILTEAQNPTGTIVEIGTALATDAVGVDSLTHDAPESFVPGDTVVTWTATDAAGNTSSASHTVTVTDTTAPSVAAPASLTIEATSETATHVDISMPLYSDLIGVDSVTNDAPESFALGDTTVSWTVRDTSGNEHTVTQTIHIIDTTPPEIARPQHIVAEAESEFTAVDIGTVDVTDAVHVASITNNAPESFALGDTLVSWVATDGAGNTSNAVQQVTLVDTTAPTLEVPEDIRADATSAASTEIDIGMASASDSVSDVIIANNAPESFALGKTTVMWSASDYSGNTIMSKQTISIVDATAPIVVAPADLTVEAESADGSAFNIGRAHTSDAAGDVTLTNDAPDAFAIGSTVVTWTAVDASGNESATTQIIVVRDTVPPRLITPDDVITEALSRDATPVNIGRAHATDAVGITSLANDAPESFELGTTIVTWEAGDAAGNTVTAYQRIIILDTTAPEIRGISDITMDATSLLTLVQLDAPAAHDLVDGAVSLSSDAPNAYPLGTTQVVWTATDSTDNASSITQTVTVLACGESHESYNAITGTPEGDTIDATPRADLVFSLGGNDIINAGDGDDCVFAGDGNDIILGSSGNDMIYGGNGDDVLKGQHGDDTLRDSAGSNVLDGGNGEDVCTSAEDDVVFRCTLE